MVPKAGRPSFIAFRPKPSPLLHNRSICWAVNHTARCPLSLILPSLQIFCSECSNVCTIDWLLSQMTDGSQSIINRYIAEPSFQLLQIQIRLGISCLPPSRSSFHPIICLGCTAIFLWVREKGQDLPDLPKDCLSDVADSDSNSSNK